MICDKDEQGYILPLWFDGVDSCLDFLKGKKKNGFLYFFQIDNEFFKVGVSNGIISRLKAHRKKLGNRIGTIGIIGEVTLYKQIECLLHFKVFTTKRGDGKYLVESRRDIYDTETYEIPDGVDFKEMINNILKVLRYIYLSNCFDILGKGEKYGIDIFNPNTKDKGLSAFLMEFNDLL